MHFINVVLIALAVSIDGFWGGFAFGLKKTKIPAISLIIICSWSVVCTMITMLIGHFLINYLPFTLIKWIGAVMLCGIGIMALKEGVKKRRDYQDSQVKPSKVEIKDVFKILNNPLLADVDNQNDIKPSEANLLGLAVALDASIAAFALGIAGLNPFITPFLFGVTHFILIGIGNIVARRRFFEGIGVRFSFIPGLVLIILGISRLI